MFRGTTSFCSTVNSFSQKTLIVLWSLVCLIPQFSYGQNTAAQTASEAPILELGKPLERELSGGQSHDYQIILSTNQYARVTVEQRGIDVVVRVKDGQDKLLTEFDSEIRPRGTEKIELVSLTSGAYKLEIQPKFKNAPASRYEVLFAEVRAATEADYSLQEAQTLFVESLRLNRAGKFKEALPLAERALEIREKILGSEHPAVAILLNRIGILNFSLGDTLKAETLFKRALEIYQKQPEQDDVNIADALSNLAVLYKNRSEFAEAEAMFESALALREKSLGADHTLVAAVLNNLGSLYRRRGDNAKAERIYERSLEIRERTLGADHPDLAPVLENLAALNYYKGDYVVALMFDRRALEIHEKNLGADHPSIADDLTNLALVYADGGESEKAEPLDQRALEIYEKNFGPNNIKSTAALNNLAELYQRRGDYAKAEQFYQLALQIAEKGLGESDTVVALYLYNFGGLETLKGNYAKAEAMLKRALEIREKKLGADHYDVGRSCDALAQLYALKGDVPQALTFQERANRINEKNLSLNLATGSEHQKLAYMSLLSEDLNQTIALHADMAQQNARAREQAITTILQRKGRVLDAVADSFASLRQRSEPQDQILFDKLNDTNAQLAELTFSEPEQTTLLAEHQKKIAAIQEQKDKLESEISRRSAGFYESSQSISLSKVQNLIPADAALIEFAVYTPIDAKTNEGKSQPGEAHFVAYIISNQGDARWVKLDSVKEIDARLEAYRQALRDPKRKDVQQLARAVDEKVMQPVRALLGGATHLLISPDGELNLIPFEALVNEQWRYLIEDYSFTYLTSGRDLLRMQTARQSKSKPLIIADPSFGESATEQIAKVSLPIKPNARNVKRHSVTAARDLSGVYFAPLIGTAQEARSIQNIFPEAVTLTGAQATKSAVKQIVAPSILHIATHGFFLSDSEANGNDSLPASARSFKSIAKIENPLLRSGLALAGANGRNGTNETGILTALEASGLNLWGTKLVVLSACDTGLGEIKNGEGVYGLRRAFVLAGAESLVMSLWSVSDYTTRELMTRYYKNLKNGMGRAAALRQVQLEMLKQPARQHPFYWAGFIQSGEWANLDGKR